ncbi:MAG: response regulator [Oscillospiraceae bacterium]|jgi:signal transduction histidine kinase/CheY-like chemotaxis protein|nr:response regulator [Oscillospiraceae bacterium]
MIFKKYLKNIIDVLGYKETSENQLWYEIRIIGIISLMASIVSFVMSFMNFFQQQYRMLIATIILMIAFAIIFILSLVVRSKRMVSYILCFLLSAICIYFTLSGGNDGFAVLWILLLPPFVMFIIGFDYGIIISVFFEIFLITLFWTPFNEIVRDYYTQTFMLRFPMLYTASFAVAFLSKYSYTKMKVTEYQALSANKAKSEFLSRVSHELRTPLNVVLSMAKLGLNDRQMEQCTKRFEKIITSSNHLSDIINDVLDMSRIEAGKIEIKKEPIYLKSVVEECMEIFSLQAKESNINLLTNVDRNVPKTLSGDEFRIRQVLINLLSNAVKFTENGQISLDVKVTERDTDKCTVLFTVADTGIGMSEEFLKKIFSPFEQEDSFFNRRHEGSGLGMSISHNLTALMGGNMNVESNLGKGSRFTFTIPFDIAETEERKEEAPVKEEFSLKGKKILIVDDIEINRIIALEVFADTGAEMEEACDGEDAYQKFLQSPIGYYDCIFMDIQMPKMDGYAATIAIRTSGRTDSTVPVIAVSANALREDVDNAIASGMNDHSAKPIDFDDCIKKAAKWCNEKK